MGARYVVFHVSDVSVEEGFTYHWRHTHEEVIDAAGGGYQLSCWETGRGPSTSW